MFKRVVLIVLDGVGCGALPDAEAYGDVGTQTLQHVAESVGGVQLPTLQRLGLGNIVPLAGVAPCAEAQGCWGRMAERSAGKDSTTGHWEMAGVILTQPFRTYAQGFPDEIMQRFRQLAGVEALGNIAASGTEIIQQLGPEHLRSGRPIVYTSTDSVFQIAAHEEVMPLADLYRLCEQMRHVLDSYQIGRVIARPFVGDPETGFRRTSRRHDYSMEPPPMLLDMLQQAGIPVHGVGKISDIFCGRGLARHWPTSGNSDGMHKTLAAFDQLLRGLVFTNLIDFDMLYGHRNDAQGFARALEQFDRQLGEDLLPRLQADDLLIITADHGCDPTMPGTDHTREHVPLIVCRGGAQVGKDLGLRSSFADISATLLDNFSLAVTLGDSFLSSLGES
ncbi:MAG: phosphopentomutase [Desulfuromonadaceae bacterium]|nr:phosphopentomutase [Desulfuromonadaceae bacterium]